MDRLKAHAEYSNEVQQPSRPGATLPDLHDPNDLRKDLHRPPCPQFASRGSGVRVPSAPPLPQVPTDEGQEASGSAPPWWPDPTDRPRSGRRAQIPTAV